MSFSLEKYLQQSLNVCRFAVVTVHTPPYVESALGQLWAINWTENGDDKAYHAANGCSHGLAARVGPVS
jgi:hypothetical protein